jgi:hypothetical protein
VINILNNKKRSLWLRHKGDTFPDTIFDQALLVGMTSARKIKTNRTNAQASTGPKTAQGKARAAKNARGHGLSVSIPANPAWSREVELLAQEIAGEQPDHEIYEHARRVAAAQIELNRISQARCELLTHKVHDQLNAQPRQKTEFLPTDWTERLLLMNRYEQRAFTRRKLAIRAFDLAREQVLRTRKDSHS